MARPMNLAADCLQGFRCALSEVIDSLQLAWQGLEAGVLHAVTCGSGVVDLAVALSLAGMR